MHEYLTPEQVEELERRTWGQRATQVSPEEAHALILEVVRLRGQVASLTDLVVMAAGLCFERITNESEKNYASEVLHESAVELVKANPRLAGAFPTIESEW